MGMAWMGLVLVREKNEQKLCCGSETHFVEDRPRLLRCEWLAMPFASDEESENLVEVHAFNPRTRR